MAKVLSHKMTYVGKAGVFFSKHSVAAAPSSLFMTKKAAAKQEIY